MGTAQVTNGALSGLAMLTLPYLPLIAMELKPKIRIGTAGWSYKDWEGSSIPPGCSSGKIIRSNI